MPAISGGSLTTIPEPYQSVWVNGIRYRNVFCRRVSETIGIGPTVAEFEVPYSSFFDNLSGFRETEVVVYANQQGRFGDGGVVFRGFMDMDDAELSDRSTLQTFRAQSILSKLSRVYVGQYTHSGTVEFPKFQKGTRTRTEWNVAAVLEWMFDSDNLDSNWRSLVRLGDISALKRRGSDYPLHGITFTGESYLGAIQRLAALAGNIVVRERFTGTRTLLDFVEFGDPFGPARRISAPTVSRGPSSGSVAIRVRESRSAEDLRTRVIGYGQPDRFMITASTVNGHLTPAHSNPTAYTETSGFTADENAVLLNPDIVNPDREKDGIFDKSKQFVMRLFRLSEAIRDMTILDANAWRQAAESGETEGKRIEIQVFGQYPNYSVINATPTDGQVWVQATASTTQYSMIKNVKILPGGYVLLPVAGVIPYQIVKATGKNAWTAVYARSHIYVTITVARPANARLYYDTGTRGRVNYGNLQTVGLVETFVNENIGREYVGLREEDNILDNDGDAIELGAIWYDPKAELWKSQTAGTQATIRDDSEFLIQLAESAARERGRRTASAEIVLPYLLTSVSPGDPVVIDTGRTGQRSPRMQVTAVTRGLYDVNGGSYTSILATDRVPWKIRPASATPPSSRRDAGAGMNQQQGDGQMRFPSTGMTEAEESAALRQQTEQRAKQYAANPGAKDAFFGGRRGDAGPSAAAVQEALQQGRKPPAGRQQARGRTPARNASTDPLRQQTGERERQYAENPGAKDAFFGGRPGNAGPSAEEVQRRLREGR